MSEVLQFGIPSFDRLFGRPSVRDFVEKSYTYDAYGIQLAAKQSTSLSLIGPDGTGKSVFGLHLAAQYIASFDDGQKTRDPGEIRWCPRVLYISTDLKHPVAEVMWQNFGLNKPNQRDFPFYWAYRHGNLNHDREVTLVRLDPANIQIALEDSLI